MIQDDSSFCFDVVGRMLIDTAFAERVTSAHKECQAASSALAIGKGSKESIIATTGRLVEACNYNIGMLMPGMYPNFDLDPDTNEMVPLDYTTRPYMFALSNLATDCTLSMVTGRQVGKCLKGSTILQTSRGDMTMQELFDEGLPVH